MSSTQLEDILQGGLFCGHLLERTWVVRGIPVYRITELGEGHLSKA